MPKLNARSTLRIGASIIIALLSSLRPAAAGPDFGGVWTGPGCEPYPGGPYARREIIIEGNHFSQVITAYNDPVCMIGKLRMRVEGTLVFKGISPIIPSPGVYDIELRWEQVYLRPEHTNQADFLNTHRPNLCGGFWSVGAEQDLAPTKGCRKLGIDLSRPITEFDITGRVGDQIFFGTRPAAGGLLTGVARRPISFGAPLNLTNIVEFPTIAPDPPAPRPAGAPGGSGKLLPVTGVRK